MAKNVKFPGAAQYFKRAERVICTVDQDGHRIIVTDGYILLALSEADYNDIMLPIFKTPVSDWTAQKGEVAPSAPSKQMIKMLDDLDGERVAPTSIIIDTGRVLCRGYCNDSTVTFFDEKLRDCFSESAAIYSAGMYKPAAVMLDDIKIGLLLPIRAEEKAVAAVRAAYMASSEPLDDKKAASMKAAAEYKKMAIEAKNNAAEEKARADQLMDAAAELREKLQAQAAELESLRAELAKKDAERAELERKAAEDIKAAESKAPATKADQLIKSLGELNGAKITVRGTEDAPTVYIQSDSSSINRKLRAAGARYDSRRKAYYIAA